MSANTEDMVMTEPVSYDRKEKEAGTKANDALAADLAALRYPGLSHLKFQRKRNPAQVMLAALRLKNLDARLTEALPWVLLEYSGLDWQWLVHEAELSELQNKLGFLTNVARRLAEKLGREETANLLREQEATLERSRLMHEETLGHDSLTEAERRWLRSNRSKEAEHWGLLTDLSPDHLSHVDLNRERESITLRARREDRRKFDEFLARVPDVPPRPGDEI